MITDAIRKLNRRHAVMTELPKYHLGRTRGPSVNKLCQANEGSARPDARSTPVCFQAKYYARSRRAHVYAVSDSS